MAPPNKPKLPKLLRDQLGLGYTSTSRNSHPHPGTRKDLRKAARTEKKRLRNGPPPNKRTKVNHAPNEADRDSDSENSAREEKLTPEKPAEETRPQPKSISKPTKTVRAAPEFDQFSSTRGQISKSIRDQLAEDDDEIAALEKKLGLKGKKKLPQSFRDDGLDELLGDLNDEEDSCGQDSRQDQAASQVWLQRKRREAQNVRDQLNKVESNNDDEENEEEESLDIPEHEELEFEDIDMVRGGLEDEQELSTDKPKDHTDGMEKGILSNDYDGFGYEYGEEGGGLDRPGRAKVRENPYVAPVTEDAALGKYIPPSLRKPASDESETLTRLRRHLQGLINRLTESNMISFLGEVEKIYRDNPRQHVTSTLIDLLLTSICERTSLPDTLIILLAGFISATYKVIGMDFGAQLVQRAIELFDQHYLRFASDLNELAETSTDNGKETSNLIMLLCELYIFRVIGSNLIFDYVRFLLDKLSELHVELLLRIVRTSGPQLRQDDPSSLKDIVAMLRPAVMSAGGEANVSVRTKFMIETINDLRNNKMKGGGASSAVTSEHTIRMKKILGTINARNLKASEPLRFGLKDIKDADKKGKWWLIGASWSGNTTDKSKTPTTTIAACQVEKSGTSDLLQLATEQRMNTDVRRAIFVTIMSAADYKDAHLHLVKLKLKKVQEYEIPKVLINCSGAEKAYNPYYTLIAKKLCGERRLQSAFQFCLWDLFKRMGESGDDGMIEDEGNPLETRHIVNLAKMFGTLIADGALRLSVLKNLNLSYLQSRTKIFIEVLFVDILLHLGRKRDEQPVTSIFNKVKDMPELITGLQYFLKKVVRKTDIAGGKGEKAMVKWACKIAEDTLESLSL